jgi:hypothetical protein
MDNTHKVANRSDSTRRRTPKSCSAALLAPAIEAAGILLRVTALRYGNDLDSIPRTAFICTGGIVPHHESGWVMRRGCTRRSNSSAETYPSLTASSRNVVPFLCAALAICAALS